MECDLRRWRARSLLDFVVKVAIHQPNLLPHKGFFDKMAACNIFVLVGHCQFWKGGYQNRFHMGDDWFTMSVKRGLVPIREKQYAEPYFDWSNIKRRLPEHPVLNEFGSLVDNSLWQTNVAIILSIAAKLRITTLLAYDFPTNLLGSERLLEICQHYKADTYLSGPSGRHYLDVGIFKKAGIKVEFQEPAPSVPILEVLK